MSGDSPLVGQRMDDVRDRQWSAWQRGERLLIEALIAGVTPPLTDNELLELIYAEVTLRAERGEVYPANEYFQRFPQFAESLRRLFAIHEALESPEGMSLKSVEPPREGSPRSSRTPRSSDRNLLFGILALQMDFIGREALIDALRDWTTQKDKPLEQILVERGDLSAARRELLEPLVDEHVRRHDHDPAASLASLSSVVDGTVDWHRVHDVEIAESLAVRRLTRNVTKADEKSGTNDDRPTTSSTRFRVLRPHARGGIGEVFLAFDEELHREVALKEIQSRHLRDESHRERFVREAEVTGGLEHPGIVPVYSLGHHGDGRPFYAMRFIRGDSLKEAIEQFHAVPKSATPVAVRDDVNSPTVIGAALPEAPATPVTPGHGERLVSREEFASVEFRQLLGRFVDVCQAIEYAHSRGVLHRDLKPGNIMLGKYGETLVVDWGLAKAAGKDDRFADSDEATFVPSSGSGVELTQQGSVVGTPAYMSPEQAAGKLDRLGPAADVYSLGATLYHVLTGQPPISNQSPRLTIPELLQRVQRGEFPVPREINSQIPKPLEAICLKAMSLRPTERYASTAELAADVERYLADEPVTALTEQFTIRARRWVKKHQTLVGSTAAAVLVSVVTLSVLVFVVTGKNASLAKANSALTTANSEISRQSGQITERNETLKQTNEQLSIAKAAVEAKRTEADVNAQVARRQSQLALKSLESVIFDIQRGLENVPGAGELRRKLLLTAIARLKEVSDQFASRGAIDRSTAAALDDLGDVFLRIGSATPGDAIEGTLAAARKLYEQSFQIRQKLAAVDPSDVQAQRALSVSYNKLGNVLLQSGQVAEALGQYQKCLEISQKLAAADPSNAQAQRDRSISYEKLGDVLLQSGQVAEALGQYQKSFEIWQKLAAADPTDAQAQRALSMSYLKLGDALLQSGQVTEALRQYQKGLEISQKLAAAADPSDARALRDLSFSYEKLGDVLLQSWQVTAALGQHQQGLEIRQKLAAADPSDARALRDLSISYEKLGNVLLQSGQVTAALGQHQQGLEIRQKLAAADPSDAEAQRDLSASYQRLGDVLLQSGQVTEALGQYQKFLAISQKLAAADPSDAQAQFILYISNAKLGDLNQRSKRFGEAITWYEVALELLHALERTKRLAPSQKSQIGVIQNRLQECRHAATALGDWKTLLEQPAEVLPMLLEMRGTQSIQAGRSADAVQAVTKLRELSMATADQLYNAACVYSLCAAAIKREKDELTAEQAAQRQQHIAAALTTLHEAIAAGWKDFAHMQKDPDLAPLRDLPDFKALCPKQN